MRFVPKIQKSGKTMWDNILNLNVKGVLLDLDDTLYAYQPCHSMALNAWVEYVSEDLSISQEEARNAYKEGRQWTNLQLHGQASSHSRLLYSQHVAEQFKKSPSYIIKWHNIYWNTFIQHMTLFPNVIPFLEDCKIRNLKIALVSDMTAEIQFKKLIHLKIDQYFDTIVTSELSGQEKPFAQPFLLALHKMKLLADEVIMIGDSEKKDVNGAKILGIKTYLPFFELGNKNVLK